MVYKQLTLRAKSAKQVLEFDHHAKSNNKRNTEGKFCNIASEKSFIVP